MSAEVIRQRLAAIDPPPVPLTVRVLHYVTYGTQQLFGPLTSHHRLLLDG